MENQVNNFLDVVKKEIGGIEDHLRSDYFRFMGSQLLESDNISIRNTMTQLTSVNGMDMFEKVQQFFTYVKTLRINGSYECEHCGETNTYELVGIGNFFG